MGNQLESWWQVTSGDKNAQGNVIHEGSKGNTGATNIAKGFIATSTTITNLAWYMNSKAIDNVISKLNQLNNKVDYEGRQKLQVGN